MPHCLLPPGAVSAGPVTAAGSRSAVRIFSQTSHCPAIPDARSANELKQLFTYLTLFVSLNQSCFQEILLCIPGLHTRTAYLEHTGISCRGHSGLHAGSIPGRVRAGQAASLFMPCRGRDIIRYKKQGCPPGERNLPGPENARYQIASLQSAGPF